MSGKIYTMDGIEGALRLVLSEAKEQWQDGAVEQDPVEPADAEKLLTMLQQACGALLKGVGPDAAWASAVRYWDGAYTLSYYQAGLYLRVTGWAAARGQFAAERGRDHDDDCTVVWSPPEGLESAAYELLRDLLTYAAAAGKPA